ncbi:hypothetical protein MOQ72_27140 [Saccharopolyspora sp. K220]|uniref:hypothetical protein n=1 Tax=Saccharopolyspora soli TaxID=2926618 RepID=UPI001F56366F|nr:hypothetical protein [Saccharopolyspora soli]MCI2421124.1 hypothetical protein [Saccharopolyspora soli]
MNGWLNERRRLYLSTIYDVDQAAERDIKAARARWEKDRACRRVAAGHLGVGNW